MKKKIILLVVLIIILISMIIGIFISNSRIIKYNSNGFLKCSISRFQKEINKSIKKNGFGSSLNGFVVIEPNSYSKINNYIIYYGKIDNDVNFYVKTKNNCICEIDIDYSDENYDLVVVKTIRSFFEKTKYNKEYLDILNKYSKNEVEENGFIKSNNMYLKMDKKSEKIIFGDFINEYEDVLSIQEEHLKKQNADIGSAAEQFENARKDRTGNNSGSVQLDLNGISE